MLTYEHGNRECTGSQMLVDIRTADEPGGGGAIFIIRPQCGLRDARGMRMFDDSEDGQISIEVSAQKVAHVISALRGGADGDLDGGGRMVGGVDARRAEERRVMYVDAVARPFRGHAFHIKSIPASGGGAQRHGKIVLNQTEALALEAALSASMGRIAFG